MNVDTIAKLIPSIKPEVRVFHSVPIKDCGEKLLSLADMGIFAFETPHPYLAAGAPYGKASPFMLRQSIAEKLKNAAADLKKQNPNWKIKIFDGYRPIAVQAYMVAHCFVELSEEQNLDPLQLNDTQKKEIFEKVYRIWSPPNNNINTPPPHSTGAAVDVTLVDENGHDIDMGSPIDYNGDESDPDFFKDKNPTLHQNRLILRGIMHAQGFVHHPREWWHYSYGDQLWAWLQQQQGKAVPAALYGRADEGRSQED